MLTLANPIKQPRTGPDGKVSCKVLNLKRERCSVVAGAKEVLHHIRWQVQLDGYLEMGGRAKEVGIALVKYLVTHTGKCCHLFSILHTKA